MAVEGEFTFAAKNTRCITAANIKEEIMENKVYPTIKNALLLCLLFLGISIGLGLIIGVFRLLLGIPDTSPLSGVLEALVSVISFGIVLLIGFKKTKRKFNEVFKFNAVSPFLWIAATVFILGLHILNSELDNVLIYFLPMPEMLIEIFETLMAGQILILSIIMVGIIPGFTEELLFRGLILDGLMGNYSKRKAIIISSLLFGIIHLNPWQFLAGFIFGLAFAWVCIKTNSLLLCIYMHFFNNILGTAATRLKDIIPIKGYNTISMESTDFQPLWFDLSGLVLLAFGIMLLMKGFEKTELTGNGADPTPTPSP
jgi:membrane protease YdiL (CAAX protease family)